MLRQAVAAFSVGVASVLMVGDPGLAAPVHGTDGTWAAGDPSGDTDLPGTTLEAEERDDGNTSAAPWVIGSGLVALVSIAIGGTLLKRRQD